MQSEEIVRKKVFINISVSPDCTLILDYYTGNVYDIILTLPLFQISGRLCSILCHFLHGLQVFTTDNNHRLLVPIS